LIQRHRRRKVFNSVHRKSGWRYGFPCFQEDGSRVYSDIFSKSPGTGELTVPAKTKFLWLVVSGAPTEHWIHVGRRRRGEDTNSIVSVNEQWPYHLSSPHALTIHRPLTLCKAFSSQSRLPSCFVKA